MAIIGVAWRKVEVVGFFADDSAGTVHGNSFGGYENRAGLREPSSVHMADGINKEKKGASVLSRRP